MSTLKVNSITPESGTTVTVNDVKVGAKLDVTGAVVVGLDVGGWLLESKAVKDTLRNKLKALGLTTKEMGLLGVPAEECN